MSDRPRWQDALDAARRIQHCNRDCEMLVRIAQLPFVPLKVLEQLAGLKRGGLARVVARFIRSGLVRTIASLTAGHGPRLLYLTDLGLGTLALLEGVEPVPFAERMGMTHGHLMRLITALPALQDGYQLLGAIAASRPPCPSHLVRWEWPYRRRYLRPTNKAPVWVRLPAFAELVSESRQLRCLLVPDRGQLPMRAYRPALDHLVAMRAANDRNVPVLIIATHEGRREQAWKAALYEVAASRAEAPLAAHIARWSDLLNSLRGLSAFGTARNELGSPCDAEPPDLPALKPRTPGRDLPRVVGSALSGGKDARRPAERLAQVALSLSPSDRDLLDLVGRHPFLSCQQLARLLDRGVRTLRWQRNRLTALGLIRVVQQDEIPQWRNKKRERSPADAVGGLELAELTKRGLDLIAARWGFPVGVINQFNALVGGGPQEGSGARWDLLRHLRHTVEANAICIDLLLAALRRAQTEGDDNPSAIWRSAAACTRGALRPDGYVMIDHGPRSFGFFVEYDRSTESGRDYRRKFAAYYGYREGSRLMRDYDGFPTILVVTSGSGAEERIARAIRAVSTGRVSTLPILLTTVGWTEGHQKHLLGPIWRDPWDKERRQCLLDRTWFDLATTYSKTGLAR